MNSYEEGAGPDWDPGTWGSDELTGSYLALKAIDVPEDAVVQVEVVNGTNGPVTLDNDLNVIFHITNKDTQKVKFTATLGEFSYEKEYDLKQIDLVTVSAPEVNDGNGG